MIDGVPSQRQTTDTRGVVSRRPAPPTVRIIVLALAFVAALALPASTLAAGRARNGAASPWIVAVARDGGSAIGRRASPRRALPRPRDGRGDPAARRTVQRILRRGGIRPTTTYRHAFDGFAALLTPGQVATLRRDRDVAVLVRDTPTHVERVAPARVDRTRLRRAVTPTGVRRVRATTGPLSRVDGVNDLLDVDVAVIDTGIAPARDLRIAGGFDCSSDDPDAWRDREGHGTHVAGTIAARDDRSGVVGVAPGARLWAVKIFDDAGAGLLSEELCGLDRVLGMRDPVDPGRPRVEVVNLSMGQWLTGADDRDCGRLSGDLVHGAICALVADGTTVVVAAGNQSVSTTLRQPAAYDEVITVSALADFDGRPGGVGRQAAVCPAYSPDVDDTYAEFSNFGPDVDLIAPGKCILSTLPDGWFGWSTGTSMATPHVTGAAALIAAAHPGARPSQVRAALLGAATSDWATGTDPDGRPDPLLDVSRLDGLPDLALEGPDDAVELAPGGVARIDVALRRSGGHAAPVVVSLSDLPDGIRAGVAPSPTGADSVRVWLSADDDAPTGPFEAVIRASDGDLVRTAGLTIRVRRATTRVGFAAPGDGSRRLVITDADQVPVSFVETSDGSPPAQREVLRQSGTPVEPGTCQAVDWVAEGDPVAPEDLDPTGSPQAGWSFPAELATDGCTRWLVRLTDEEGASTRFASPAVLRDTTEPREPRVVAEGTEGAEGAEGAGVATRRGVVWVRASPGTMTLVASGGDAGSGVATYAWSDLDDPTGWTAEPAGERDARRVLTWGPDAVDTRLRVRATDQTGRTGAPREVQLRVDASGPRVAGWLVPRDGDRVTGAVVELLWRKVVDVGSGPARLQQVQRQVGAPDGTSCVNAAWVDDGPPRWAAQHDEQWDLRSGSCYRWILTPRDQVGNAGVSVTSGSVYVDLLAPSADFLTPDEGTVTPTSAPTYRVAWVEDPREGGGRSFRALERERARAVGASCPVTGWVRVGKVDRGPSPSRAVGLQPGWCYRWRLNLADDRDNVEAELSGVLLITAP